MLFNFDSGMAQILVGSQDKFRFLQFDQHTNSQPKELRDYRKTILYTRRDL
jgi:hypothetical protein